MVGARWLNAPSLFLCGGLDQTALPQIIVEKSQLIRIMAKHEAKFKKGISGLAPPSRGHVNVSCISLPGGMIPRQTPSQQGGRVAGILSVSGHAFNTAGGDV